MTALTSLMRFAGAAELRVLADQFGVGGEIDAIDLVVGDVALDPLNVGTEAAQNRTGFLRDRFEMSCAKISVPRRGCRVR